MLGPIVARRDGRQRDLGGPRQRRLLALLLLEPGQPVAPARLAHELWNGSPPPGAETTLRAYVSKLRTALGTEALTREPSGYLLQVAPECVDSKRFEALLAAGRDALARGRPGRAAERLSDAMALWRGEPFDGVDDDGPLGLEAGRLAELRVHAVEERIEADIRLGRAAELVDELEGLVREHPYRERFWRQLMLALYRAERQSDALAAYRRARRRLGEDLGLEPGEELKGLEQAILRHDVPRVRPPAARSNLPAQLTSFVGRAAELADVRRLLEEARLVTLTGVGGVGKTRLVLETAERMLPECPDGVVFVDLSPLTDPTLVAKHVATAVGVHESGRTGLVDRLAARLRDAELLLVLDNCEHLHDAVAELLSALLPACPSLVVLATSREPLGVAGEIDWPVPPLGLPAPGASVAELRASEAVRLLLARVHEVRPRLDDERALAVAGRIARDLDGLPLALELAAARAKALSLEEIADALADRFRFLVSWRRLSAARHRTLRQAMDWSFELLTDDGRRVLASLSVFAGGFSRRAAAEVCVGGDDARTIEVIGRLVDASLVVAEERDGEMRYRLLETVRQYGADRLEERGATAAVRDRHADFFAGLVEAAWSARQFVDLDRYASLFEADLDNLRSALTRSRIADEPERFLRLARGLWPAWWARGRVHEGRRWLEDAVARGGSVAPVLRAEVLEGAAALAWTQSDFDRAEELAGEAFPLFVAAQDRRGEYGCLTILGHVAHGRGELDAAERLFERCAAVAARLEDDPLGRQNAALTQHNLGSVAFAREDLPRAAAHYGTASVLYRAAGDEVGVALSELFLGIVAAEESRGDDAAEHFARSLPFYRAMGFPHYATHNLEGIAVVAHLRGDDEEAARLLAAASRQRELLGDLPGGVPPGRREAVLTAARAELGDTAVVALLDEGRALPLDEALERAERVLSG